MAAVFSGVAARAPLIVTRPPRVRDSDGSRNDGRKHVRHSALVEKLTIYVSSNTGTRQAVMKKRVKGEILSRSSK